MKKLSQFISHSTLVIAVCLSSISTQLSAAPGIIENSPLFLSNSVEPNIFFMVDDSGSMNAEMLTPESVGGWGGVMEIVDGGDSRDYYWLFTSNNNSNRTLPSQAIMTTTYGAGSPTVEGVWRGRNSDYNGLYYNPTRTYEPWAGFDTNNVEYTDIDTTSPVNAPIDPYLPAGATYTLDADNIVTARDLDNNNLVFTYYPARYWVWVDTSGEGDVDPNDQHKLIEIKATTAICTNGLSATNTEQATENSNAGCMLRTYAEEMQNFANWFSYHRSRELAAKFSMSQVIANSTNVRMGIATINEGTAAAQLELASMDNLYSAGTKSALLDSMAQINSNGGTPLRLALQRAGEYYSCSNNGPNFGGNTNRCAIQKTPAAAPPGACQQNFTILMSDGERNGGNPGVGNEDNAATTFSGFEPYADGETNSLADVAMDYYNKDLAAGVANNVPTICGVDENDAQHMVTYTVAFGVTGNIDLSTIPAHPKIGPPNGVVTGCSATTGSNFDWYLGANIDTGPERIDDMVHAAFNGRGEFLSAENPEALSDSLNNTLRSIASRTGAASAVALDASSLSANSTAYFARFNSATWEGELSAFPIDPNGVISATADWDAHTLLEAKAASDRAIVTFNPAAATFSGIPFRTLASLTAAQQADLTTTTAGILDAAGTAATDAQARLDYLRGDHSCESSSVLVCSATSRLFRDRILNAATFPNPERYKLGDVVHSSPVYVGRPPLALPNRDPFGLDGQRHRDYKYGVGTASTAFASGSNASNRTPMVYVGSNDGMLHAFSANTGEEIWAYMPNALFSTGNIDGLHKLTETDYEHKYYVDLDSTVVDAFFTNSAAAPDWHTVLVGGLRAGGRGLFAIDITDPDEIINEVTATQRETKLAARVMWEFGAADDIDMGLSYSQPQVVPIGDKGMASPIEWYVIFGNGYNSENTGTGSNPYSSKLFILKLAGPGSDGIWNIGTDYWKIDTKMPSGSVAGTNRNGMSTPAVADSNSDGIADRVYAGDLYGRVWGFDINGTNENNWDIYKSGATPTPLFTANDGAGNVQPITTKPALGFNTEIDTDTSAPTNNEPNLMVYVGTGSYLTTPDLATTGVQSFYAIWDIGESEAGHTVDRATPANSDLVEQLIDTDTAPNGDTVRIIDPPAVVTYTTDPSTTAFGWYIDLPTSGERVAINPDVIAGIAFFKTLIPSSDACGFGGTSWSMFTDAMTGLAPDLSLIDFNNDQQLGAGDETTGGNVAAGTGADRIIFNSTTASTGGGGGGGGLTCPTGFQRYIEIITLSDGTTSSIEKCLPNGTKLGRASWHELEF